MTTESNNSLLLNATHVSNELKSIASKVFNGYRISVDEGITLFEKGELNFLGILLTMDHQWKNLTLYLLKNHCILKLLLLKNKKFLF